MRGGRLLSVVVSAAVLVVAVACLGVGLARQWPAITAHRWRLDPWLLALSVVLAAGWFACRGWLWQLILGDLGCRVPYRAALRAWAVPELARYIPGKVWYIASRAYLCSQCGAPASASLAGMTMELALLLLTAVAFSAVRLGAVATAAQGYLWPVVGGVALFAVAAHPRVLLPAINAALRRAKRPALPVIGGRDYLRLVGVCLLAWACLAAGFTVFVRAAGQVAWADAPLVATSYPFAWLVGIAAVVLPGGIGVREGVLAAMLGGVAPGGMALPLAVLARVWITLAELACALISLRLASPAERPA